MFSWHATFHAIANNRQRKVLASIKQLVCSEAELPKSRSDRHRTAVSARALAARVLIPGRRAPPSPTTIKTRKPLSMGTYCFLYRLDDREQRVVDLEPIFVFDKPQSLEFLHKEIHARSRRADHFGQRLLGERRDSPHGFVVLAVPREQQQLSCQPLLAGAKELVDQVFLDPDGTRQQ